MLSWNVHMDYSPPLPAKWDVPLHLSANVRNELLNVQNMAENRRNLHQLLKWKQLYGALYGMYTAVLHDLTAVLNESAAKGETYKTTITAPPSMAEFHQQRIWKQKHTDDAYKKIKEAYNFNHWSQRPPIAVEARCSYPELLRPTEVNWKEGWPRRRSERLQQGSVTSGTIQSGR
jgi:hypothetical protein